MFRNDLILVGFFLYIWNPVTSGICPPSCYCGLDIKGRRQVICTRGGMVDPIPLTFMDQQAEVIRISAPLNSSNDLTIGPIFQQFTQLEELHITRSNVPAIGRHSFWGVPTLKILDLSSNNITHVQDYNFRGLVNLIELRLDDNNIESMPSGTFRFLEELKILSVAKNNITELVPRLFLKLGKLHELDLSGNRLIELNPEVFKDVQELRVFRCRACELININTLIYRLLPDLMELDFGDNEFKYIASDEFIDLKNIQVLLLDGNQLPVVLEKTFSKSVSNGVQQELQTLNLARNRLAKVTATAFANLTSLRDLNLGYNKLDRLETATFVPLSDSLRRLDLSGNAIPISDVQNVLELLTKLRDLSLADMSLSNIPLGLLVYHEHLRFLNMSGNNFVNFNVQILSRVPKLHEIDLSRNRFHGLDERLATRLETIKNVHLTKNLWICDICHMNSILNRLNKTSLSHALQKLTCAAPSNYKGRLVATLHIPSLEWCITGDGGIGYMEGGGITDVTDNILSANSRLGLIVAGIVILLLVVTGAALLACVVYSKHHAAHYYTHEDKRVPEQEAIFENHGAILEENGDVKYKIVPMDQPPKKKKKVTICTIDTISKDPELRTLTNGT